MPADLHKAREIFLHAVGELPPEQWEGYVDLATGGDADLKQQVIHFLKVHLEAGSFLCVPFGGSSPGMQEPSPGSDPLIGTNIGPYKLYEKLGEGGMGTVWLAHQNEPIKRTVALKLIKTGMNSKTVLARFDGERQALALMDHPNIAKVLEAGETAQGQPYFVMELVKGIPITMYCDEERLTPRQRLELFIPVCQAVQHAHQKGIIHRDLKPSNVLIAVYDGRPVPKVIDFGVAKATGPQHSEESLNTGFGDVVGTVEYMSPEQATLNQLDIDTRSDIYSLGILLYELLTGSPPFTSRDLKKASLLEVLRIIREQEPSRPSTKLSTAEGLPTLAANRGTEPKRLTALVRGELDWIVMKALEKDRNRRYETADRLAADLQCYLSDQPVQACPPSPGYQLRKLLSRNKRLVLGTIVLMGTLIAGVVGTSWGLIRAVNARVEEETQRGIAENAANAERAASQRAREKELETKAVLDFVESKILAAVRPKGQEGGLGPEVTLRQAVEAAVSFVDKSFPDQPLTEARLRMTLGSSFYLLGEWNQAAVQFHAAQALYRSRLGTDHLDTLKCTNGLANCYFELGRYEDSLQFHQETYRLRKTNLGDEHVDTLGSMINVANCLVALNRDNEALPLREQTLAVAEKTLGADHPDTLLCMSNLANSYAQDGQQERALRLRERVFELRHAHPQLGPSHPDTLRAMNNLAVSYDYMDRHHEALQLREKVLAKRKSVLPIDHPDTLNSMHNLGFSLAAVGRHEEALKVREETLALTRAKLGERHLQTLRGMTGVALSYSASGRHNDALLLHQETLALRREIQPLHHPDILQNMYNLANTLSDLNRHAEALQMHQDTLALRKGRYAPTHPQVFQSLQAVVNSLMRLERGAETIPLIDEAWSQSADKSVDDRLLASLVIARIKHFEKVHDPAGCRACASMWEGLHRSNREGLYLAARLRAVTARVQRALVPSDAGVRLAEAENALALEWLRKAVAAGERNVERLSAEPDFTDLRSREDFKKLLADLKALQKR